MVSGIGIELGICLVRVLATMGLPTYLGAAREVSASVLGVAW